MTLCAELVLALGAGALLLACLSFMSGLNSIIRFTPDCLGNARHGGPDRLLAGSRLGELWGWFSWESGALKTVEPVRPFLFGAGLTW